MSAVVVRLVVKWLLAPGAIMRFPILLIPCLYVFGNPVGASVADKGQRPSRQTRLTWSDLVKRCAEAGDDAYLPQQIGSHLGLDGDPPTKSINVETTETGDDMAHDVNLVLKVSSSGIRQPLAFNLVTGHDWPGHVEHYHFRVTLDGVLERAVTISGLKDQQGNTISGSGSVAEKDIDSPEIKERFQHEVDFWLKGAYRKKKGKARPRKAAPELAPARVPTGSGPGR
ncbi:MAG: hypothetical protein HY554_13395 [Elusimicrobia bacterium]|nr:hypothetical protein [Elusimicrobiota bacterium]